MTQTKFSKLEHKIARGYEKTGMSKAHAEAIGRATAGKIFWHKFGKRKGERKIKAAKAKKHKKRK